MSGERGEGSSVCSTGEGVKRVRETASGALLQSWGIRRGDWI